MSSICSCIFNKTFLFLFWCGTWRSNWNTNNSKWATVLSIILLLPPQTKNFYLYHSLPFSLTLTVSIRVWIIHRNYLFSLCFCVFFFILICKKKEENPPLNIPYLIHVVPYLAHCWIKWTDKCKRIKRWMDEQIDEWVNTTSVCINMTDRTSHAQLLRECEWDSLTLC